MTRKWHSKCWKFGLASAFLLSGVYACGGNRTLAQPIIPDATLGAERSVFTSGVDAGGVPIDRIEGGATRGVNLFHSFQEFNVGNGRAAYFTNPPGIENILSRVTGTNPSNIEGTLGVSGGNANLFLLNPNGIIFGQNASLDIGGSFVASTARSLVFEDATIFSAAPDTPTAPLLTISTPIGLQYGSNAGGVGVQGSNLEVNPGQTLALVGGNVNLEGGQLLAPGGRVELGGVTGEGTVGLLANGTELVLSFPDGVARGDVSLSNGAVVDVRAGGGSIAVHARNLTMTRDDTALRAGIASGRGSVDAQAGDIEVNATEAINLNGSSIANFVVDEAVGNGGNVKISTGSLSLTNGASLSANTWGQRNAGDVTIVARDSVSFDGSDRYGNRSGAYSVSKEEAEGDGGNVKISTGSLSLTNGAALSVTTWGRGNAGDVTIVARDTVSFDGESRNGFPSGAFSSAPTEIAEGDGGDVNISTGSLSLTNGALLSASTWGRGNAGDVTIVARDTVSFDGESRDGHRSGAYSLSREKAEGDGGNVNITTASLSLTNGASLSASTAGQGNAGELTVNTGELIVQNGAQVSAETSGTGRAGTLLINATDSVTVDGKNSRLNFDTRSQRGDAGDAGELQIFSQRLIVRNGAQVSARSFGAGDAGTLLVNATDSVIVDGKDSRLRFDTEGSGNAKGIRIETGRLVVQNGGQVTVSGTGTGNPGNLEVTAGTVFLNNQGGLDQRGLIAETKSGEGGNIRLQVHDTLLMRYQSLISASAQGIGNGGNVEIDIPNGFVLAFLPENSDIVASARQGNGGVARATAAGVFGFRQFRGFRTSESDFTASSELGIDGRLEIITSDRRLEQLPADFGAVEIAQGCEAARGQEVSSFVVTGRGGLPPKPQEALSPDAVEVDLVRRNPQGENRSRRDVSANSTHRAPTRLVEAQGWVMGNNGEVILTATAPTVTPHSPWQGIADCQQRDRKQQR